MDFSELIAAADPSIFTESIKAWVSGLNINSVIMLIMMIFMIVGAIDRIRGNKLGYGEKFEDGFNAIGGLAIAMAGVYAAAPVLSMVLGPIISPIYTAIGADASMFATTILACDMGGYPLAMELDHTSFEWTLTYDEYDLVLDGTLEIEIDGRVVSGGPGDIIYIPKGSHIHFQTPNRTRYAYFVYPADWQ